MSGSFRRSRDGRILNLYSNRFRAGFTLVELMVAVAVVGILASIALTTFKVQVMKAKRVEATVGLHHVWVAQMALLARTEKFTDSFAELDFDLEGGKRVSNQTYKGNRYVYQLSQPWGTRSFYCIATANLDDDAWPDVLEIYELSR